METTIRVHTDQLDTDILEGIKKMFPHTMININIQPADETDYILSNPAYANELRERIAAYESKKEIVLLKQDELL